MSTYVSPDSEDIHEFTYIYICIYIYIYMYVHIYNYPFMGR
jgi:hypothetical protein